MGGTSEGEVAGGAREDRAPVHPPGARKQD